MERRKNSNLHVVREPEDPTDKIIDEIMDELNSEDGMPEKEVREELMKRKKKKQKIYLPNRSCVSRSESGSRSEKVVLHSPFGRSGERILDARHLKW